MNHKAKGINAERELIHFFWKSQWAAVRVAGSGAQRYPSPDILASNNIRKLAIECKTTKEQSIYLDKEDIEQLLAFCAIYGAESWFAIKFKGENWSFLPPEDLRATEQKYTITSIVATQKGLSFEELINGV